MHLKGGDMGEKVGPRTVNRLWNKMKSYVAENTYPRVAPPDLLFDIETATLYIGQPNIGYDFVVENATLYYKERGV